jgi:diguanylate cyclase (GGDEF)-like protein
LKRLFPRQFSAALFAVVSFLLIYPFSWSRPLSTSLLLLLNLVLILGATYFRAPALSKFALFSLLVVSLAEVHRPLAFLLLGLTFGIFYYYLSRLQKISHQTDLELERIDEEKNIISVETELTRQLNSSLREKLQRYTALKSLTEILSASFSQNEVTSLIADEAFRIIGKSNVGLLYLVDQEKQKLNLAKRKITPPYQEIIHKQGDLFDSWVFRRHAPLLVQDTKKDFRFSLESIQEKDKRNVRSLIAAPLISENKLLGILRLDCTLPNTYDTDDLRLLDIISSLAAATLRNTQLYRETQRLGITDGLTELFVHRYFQQRFDEEISRALWTKSEFSFMMLDIDDFKTYNDKYGHIAGDIVLKKIARLISSSCNPGDIVARYGGEEFALLLVDTPKQRAAQVAELIRERIEAEKFILRHQTTEVRISAGVAAFPEDSKIKENLIQKADQALYKAKSSGKNKVCIF